MRARRLKRARLCLFYMAANNGIAAAHNSPVRFSAHNTIQSDSICVKWRTINRKVLRCSQYSSLRRMDVETMSRRINLNRIKVDVKNELAEYRDATAAFWRRLRFYSIIIIYYRIQHVMSSVLNVRGRAHCLQCRAHDIILFK